MTETIIMGDNIGDNRFIVTVIKKMSLQKD